MENFKDQLHSMFVAEDQIPAEHRIEEIHQREYLVNGEMRQWDGDVTEVYSPVCIPGPDGVLKRKLIGTYPVCGEYEAMEAMDAALAAYNNGRGEWPTMTLANRIKCME